MNEAGVSFSLKRRLLGTLLGAIALVWIGTAVFSYFDARHEIRELLDAHLAQSAALLIAQADEGLEEIDLEHVPLLHEESRRVVFQVWERGRVLRLHSANAPSERLSSRDKGFSDSVIAGREWRVFSGWDAERRNLVQVGERDEARREIAAAVVSNMLMPLAFALPALGLFAWLSITAALRPLSRIGQELQSRRADNLAPISAEGAPSEVAPLVQSLNGLFARVVDLIESERRFTADAAHELRTPLAALKTQAQVALGAVKETERQHSLDQVVAGCDRAAHLVDQLLTLSRLEPGQFSGARVHCDLHELARQASADVTPAALAKGIDLELSAPGPVLIEGYPALIAVLMRNLIDNAVRYSGRQGTVRVKLFIEDAMPVFSVVDEGPGVPGAELEKLGQRFYRILGTGETGSGLGLSIVKRIAALHGAKLELSAGPGGKGLQARVAFAAAR